MKPISHAALLTLSLVTLALGAGCYTIRVASAPKLRAEAKRTRIYQAPEEQVWEAFVDHASDTFYLLDEWERSDGLLTLAWSASGSVASRLVDCGSDPVTERELVEALNANVTGRANVLVDGDGGETTVRVSANYDVTPGSFYVNSAGGGAAPTVRQQWLFDSRSTDVVDATWVGDPSGGFPTIYRNVVCGPSLWLEISILNGISRSLAVKYGIPLPAGFQDLSDPEPEAREPTPARTPGRSRSKSRFGGR